jgi:hypothetical protein
VRRAVQGDVKNVALVLSCTVMVEMGVGGVFTGECYLIQLATSYSQGYLDTRLTQRLTARKYYYDRWFE